MNTTDTTTPSHQKTSQQSSYFSTNQPKCTDNDQNQSNEYKKHNTWIVQEEPQSAFFITWYALGSKIT